MYDVEDENRFWSKVETSDDNTVCWNVVAMSLTNRYGSFYANNKHIRAHRFSFQLKHNRLIKKNMVICHSCDNPLCVNPAHLSEGTQQENITDMCNKGRYYSGEGIKGEKNKLSKLTEKHVLEIRNKYANTTTSYSKLAKEYGISHTTIMRIINRKSWQHI
jgi:predicted transcriptional regulator